MALFKTRKPMIWPRNNRTLLGIHFSLLISQTRSPHLFSKSGIRYASCNIYSLKCMLILSSITLVTVVINFQLHSLFYWYFLIQNLRNRITYTTLLAQTPAEEMTGISRTVLQYSLYFTVYCQWVLEGAVNKIRQNIFWRILSILNPSRPFLSNRVSLLEVTWERGFCIMECTA